MGLSIDDLLAYARRVYISKDSVDSVAKELSIKPVWFQAKLRSALPRLISEENWDIPAVIENLGGMYLPLEMRKEFHKLVKKHGLAEAMRLTNVSLGSASRWGAGRYGSRGVLRMRKLPWKSMLTSAPTSAPTSTDNRHASSKLTGEQQRRAVYRMVTERPKITELAIEYDVSGPSLYAWRQALVGKAKAEGFTSRCKAFIAEFAAEVGEDPKPFVVHRDHEPRPGKKATRSRPEKAPPGTRRKFSKAFKRAAVNRFANQNESIASLIEDLGCTEANLYAWRHQVLGPKTGAKFVADARALAREFIEQAQVDDVVTHATERDVPLRSYSSGPASFEPQPYSRAPGSQEASIVPVSSLDGVATIVPSSPNAILESIDAIDTQLASLQKDRQLLVQGLEIQKLRRALSGLGSIS